MKNLLLIFILSFCCFCNIQNFETYRGGVVYPVSIDKLRCEYIENPEGIDIPKPRLSWNLVSTGRGQLQTAYQVLVASSQEMLAKNKAELKYYPQGISTNPYDVFASCFFAHSTEIVSKMAKVLGKEEDAAKYSELFQNIKSAFSYGG